MPSGKEAVSGTCESYQLARFAGRQLDVNRILPPTCRHSAQIRAVVR